MFASLLMLHGDGDFAWTRFDIHPSVLIGCTAFAVLYAWGVLRGKRRGERVETSQTASFSAGVAILFLSLNGPIHELSDYYLFSAHMVQHLLLTLVMPPLLLIGTPDWLLRSLLSNRGIRAVARAVTSPLPAFGIYNIVFAGWHLPLFYNFALENHNAHIVQHLMFIAAAVLVWWPVVEPLPELRSIPTPARMLYLFALGLPMSGVSALITLSDEVLYAWYSEAPRIFNLTALDDQQVGGLIMWVPGMMVYWIAITILFFRWSGRADKEEWEERERLAAAG